MTQEDKNILLKDLCARLPYEVVVHTWYNRSIDIKCTGIDLYTNTVNLDIPKDDDAKVYIDNVKPYLRPMSSMTDNEEVLFRCVLPAIAKTDAQLVAMRMELFLKGHLDFNHLIEKGLALEAPKDMYKTE